MKTLTLIHQEYPTLKHLFPLSFYLGSWGKIRTSHFLQLISCFTLSIYHFVLPVCVSLVFFFCNFHRFGLNLKFSPAKIK